MDQDDSVESDVPEELDAEVTELKEEEPPMVEPSIDEGEDK